MSRANMKLVITGSADAQSVVVPLSLNGDYVVGRDTACEIPLDDPKASRRHLKLTVASDHVSAVDLKSRNGSLLNGQSLNNAFMYDGDRIRIGQTHLQLLNGPPRAVAGSVSMVDQNEYDKVQRTVPQSEADLVRSVIAVAPVDSENDTELRTLRELCSISQQLSESLEPQVILKGVLDEVRTTLRADSVGLLIDPKQNDEWEVRGASQHDPERPLAFSRSIARRAVVEGLAILSGDAVHDGRFDASRSIVSHSVSSAICAPIKDDDIFIGVLFVSRQERVEPFDDMQVRMVASVANMLGMFLGKERYEQQARENMRLATIGEVVAGLAHHIKNVVGSFQFAVSNLDFSLEQDHKENAVKCSQTIAGIERRITGLMLNMLSMSKDREPEFELVETKGLIEEITAPYAPRMQKEGITLSVSCDDALPHVYGDEQAIFRALLNIFVNAMDAVRTEPEDKRDVSISTGIGADGTHAITIRDTGCGIPEDKIEEIFAAFFSTKGSRGTGLGLAATQKTIKEHKGRIVVTSEVGLWTEFRIELPPAPTE